MSAIQFIYGLTGVIFNFLHPFHGTNPTECHPKPKSQIPTTVVSTGSQTNSTQEATTTFTPPATSENKTTTTMMSTSLEGNTTASPIETTRNSTYSTQNSAAPTTNVAETTFNSSTNGSTRVITSTTISASTTEAKPSTQSEEATSSPLLEAPKKSVPVSVITGSIGGIVLIVLLTIGLVILLRKRKRRNAREDNTMHAYNIHCNLAYDPSVDNVSTSSKDSGIGKHNESMESEMMDGEYNTLRLHFHVNNEPHDSTYNHIDGSLSADSTYSQIPNSKDALFDNSYSHMPKLKQGKSFELEDKDATYNHLGDSCSSKRNGKAEESRDEIYNHAQMSHVRPTADKEDQGDNYSHINLSGLKAQMPNADEHRVDTQKPTHTTAEYAKIKEGDNNYEGHTYFVLESSSDQHSKQTPYDYAVASAPEKDHSEFTVVQTVTQHEYFVLEPTTEL